MATTRASSAASATPSADRIIRLTAVVAAGDADLAVAECHALTGVGCMQGDAQGARVAIDIWMPAAQCPGAAALRTHLAAAGVDATVSQADQDDSWRDALRDFHQPVVAGRVRVRPPWVAPVAGMHDVVIDPGMAFGTGQHPTTRTALELLQRIPVRGAVLDAGCGSGILAIAARRLGFGPVVAIDFDPDSVAATARAARANMVHGIDVRRVVIGEDPLPIAPVLLANITLEVLTVLAQQIAGAPAPGASEAPGAAVAPGAARTSPACAVEHAVLSGLREHEVDAAVAAFAPLGLAEAERMPEDGWASVRLQA